ncbi:MAG: DinB family protein [Jatrophihabitantaceae bacterium]
MADRPQADDHLADKRLEPPVAADEKATLVGFLDYQRQTLLLKCAGLSPEQLIATAVPTSDLRLLGLVRHLADVEFGWFAETFLGEPEELIWGPGDADLLIAEADDGVVTEAFARYAAEVARARTIVAEAELDQLSVGVGSNGEPFSLRWILVHMIEEYARHNGHADLIRQAIDGAIGE